MRHHCTYTGIYFCNILFICAEHDALLRDLLVQVDLQELVQVDLQELVQVKVQVDLQE
jgi:hypothetical protein